MGSCACVWMGIKTWVFVFYMALLFQNPHKIGAEPLHPYHIPNKPCVSFSKISFFICSVWWNLPMPEWKDLSSKAFLKDHIMQMSCSCSCTVNLWYCVLGGLLWPFPWSFPWQRLWLAFFCLLNMVTEWWLQEPPVFKNYLRALNAWNPWEGMASELLCLIPSSQENHSSDKAFKLSFPGS